MSAPNQHKELLAQARCTVDRLQPVNPMTLSPDSLSALDYARGLLSLEEQLEAAQAWLDAVAEVTANPQGTPKTDEWYYEVVDKVRQIVRSSGR